MSGGSESTRFYLAYQNFSQEGMAYRSDLKRNTARLNLDHKINNKMRLSVSTSLGYAEGNLIDDEGQATLQNPFAAIYLANPWEELYDDNGDLINGAYKYPSNGERNPENGNDYISYQLTGPNAYDATLFNEKGYADTKLVGAASFEWDIFKDVTFKSQYGMDYRSTISDALVHPESIRSQTTKAQNPNSPTREGSLSKGNSRFKESNFTNTLDYKSQLGEKHILGVLVGTEYIDRFSDSFSLTAYGLNSKIPHSLRATTPGTPGNANQESNYFIPNVTGSTTQRRLFSVLSQFNYMYNERYSFSASLRRDGSSAFGPENKYAVLYSTQFIWDLGRESFMASAKWVNNLKFRISYGTTGNQEGLYDYEHKTIWGSTSYNGVSGTGLAFSGNPDIKWETAEKFNLGFDYNLFNNRLSGVIDFYHDVTSDLFLSQKLPATAGVPGNSQRTNAGDVLNMGGEFLVNYDIIRSKSLRWSIGGNISYNHNEVLNLGNEESFISGSTIVEEGSPLGTLYMKKWAGVNPRTGDALYYAEDGTITDNFSLAGYFSDFGTSIAPLYGGANSSVSFKGFDVNVDFSYSLGNKRINYTNVYMEDSNLSQFNKSRSMLNVWMKPGDITDEQRVGTARYITSKDIENASFVRFRSAQIAYNLPKSILNRTKVLQGLRVYMQGQNLFTWTNWTGFDPEGAGSGSVFPYPPARTFTFGLDVAF